MVMSDFPLPSLPSSTPQTSTYPCERGPAHARNNFVPRTFARVPSASERGRSLHHILRKHWGYTSFRGPQEAICEHALKDCDILVVAPTGLGKSICFQVPAIAVEYGITIVVSPLKALMQDQVDGLRARGVKVAQLNENTTPAEHIYIKRQLRMGHPELQLLYVTPESLFKKDYEPCFRKAYEQRQIARFVIDEAHVLHEWGNGFRPKYKEVGTFVRQYPGIPKTALTASATAEVRDEITKLLDMPRTAEKGLAQWVMPFNRKNLFYDIRYLGGMGYVNIQRETTNQIIQFVTKFKPEAEEVHRKNGVDVPCISGIVYCRTVACCDMVAEKLTESGISAMPFYARMSEAHKTKVLADWKEGRVECIVATIAFGMGIDHPHVRYVVHFDMPKSFEGYYQETGRAGRDGHRSRCLMFYSREDAPKARGQAISMGTERTKQQMLNSLKALQQYAEDLATCRHIGICKFFGEEIDPKDPETIKSYCDGMCDVCSNRKGVFLAAQNLTEEFPTFSQIVPVEPLQHSSPVKTAGNNCSLAALHDETQLNQRRWISLISPANGELSSNGIEDAPGEHTHGPGADDHLRELFFEPDSDPEDSRPGRRPNQTPLFDLPSSQPEPSAVIDLTMSSSPSDIVVVKEEPPPSIAAPTTRAIHNEARPPPRPIARRAASSILQVLDVNGLPRPRNDAETSRQLLTIDQLADEGVAGAVVLGEPRSPGHAKRKMREREKAFKHVAPVSGSDSPYSFYNSDAPRKKGRVDNLRFSAPGPAPMLSERLVQNSPLGDVTTGTRDMLYNTPRTTASPAPEPITDRKSGMARLLAAATASFEKGDLAEEIFVAWKRKETGEQRLRLLKKVARELEAKVALETRHTDTYPQVIAELADSMKIARNERGVRLITSGQLESSTDKRAVNFRTVEECFRSL